MHDGTREPPPFSCDMQQQPWCLYGLDGPVMKKFYRPPTYVWLHTVVLLLLFLASASARVSPQDRKFFKFRTRPDIDAPTWNIKVNEEDQVASGYWFVAPYEDLHQAIPGDAWVGPHIYDGKGELVWSGAPVFKHWNTFDFGVGIIGGEPMMTMLSDHERAGYILDSSYEVWKRIDLDANGVSADMHSFQVIDNGTRALIIQRLWEQTAEEDSQTVGHVGSCFAKYEGFLELDLANSKAPPVFDWHASGHIALEESTFNLGRVENMCEKGWDIL